MTDLIKSTLQISRIHRTYLILTIKPTIGHHGVLDHEVDNWADPTPTSALTAYHKFISHNNIVPIR